MKATRSFAHAPESVPAARRFTAEALPGAGEEVLATIQLLVSELASNSIRHTNCGFDLTLIVDGDEIRVEATDRGAGEPQMRSSGPTDPRGRGLQIVDMFATTWGVERLRGRGKTIWFTLAATAPAGVGG
jgi:anti-sigma regulatory factor (Ser/Thr protein kinase)